MGWSAPVSELLEGTQSTWAVLWSLLYTAGHSALRLSLASPLDSGVELAYVAMDLREARDELERLRFPPTCTVDREGRGASNGASDVSLQTLR
ncbi:hypothetical protein [Cellulomonas xylanilytica]|uniref:Uncharacterized protein n=1 Tax=Cellulomonas xylanilytica TaxID=233583 RepID=A0A510V6W1_9CELL|nr:hypothetical protein [Cellulomonas xylanilytica]GEK21020.1 hypothetical protein CXY01_15400 [Cellulomonas xylanilytica]